LRIVGYDTFIKLLKAAYGLRLAGVPSAHVLVIGPPGVAKTTIAKLFSRAVGATFVRTTGRYDMLPEDFVAEKEIVYDGGSPRIVWSLRAVKKLLKDSNRVPAVWFFDEFDKMNRKSMYALLELMEEQQVTLPNGEAYPLNFMLIAAGNSRKYDRDANPIPRAVRDRFVVYWELGYLSPEQEFEVLKSAVKYLAGEDTEPSDQFRFRFDDTLFRKMRDEVVQRYGRCFVDAVHYLRKHKDVAEPPGPRAYIHATLLTAALSTIDSAITKSNVELGFTAAVAGKITTSSDVSPFDLCTEAVTKFCLERSAERSEEKGLEEEFFRGKRKGRAQDHN